MPLIIQQILFSLLTGITSAFFYSLVENYLLESKWRKTKDYFEKKIISEIESISFLISITLDMEKTLSSTGVESRVDVIEIEINKKNFTLEEFKSLENGLEIFTKKVEILRKEALLLPTFTSNNFHSVDELVKQCENFVFIASLLSDKDINPPTNIAEGLKLLLIKIIKSVKTEQKIKFTYK